MKPHSQGARPEIFPKMVDTMLITDERDHSTMQKWMLGALILLHNIVAAAFLIAVSQPRRSFNLRVHKETHIPNEKQSDGEISRLVEIRKYVFFSVVESWQAFFWLKINIVSSRILYSKAFVFVLFG